MRFLEVKHRIGGTIYINADSIIAFKDERSCSACSPDFAYTTIHTTHGDFDVKDTDAEIISKLTELNRNF